MLKQSDIVYIYMVNLEDSINSVGLSESRIAHINSIETITVNGKEEGLYVLHTPDGKEWKIPTNSITFKIAPIDEVINNIKYSKMDEKTKEYWLQYINEF